MFHCMWGMNMDVEITSFGPNHILKYGYKESVFLFQKTVVMHKWQERLSAVNFLHKTWVKFLIALSPLLSDFLALHLATAWCSVTKLLPPRIPLTQAFSSGLTNTSISSHLSWRLYFLLFPIFPYLYSQK